ncbi:MAG: type II secretion system F family protein [Acidimicrobiia bacterium]
MSSLVGAAVGLALAGPLGAALGGAAPWLAVWFHRRRNRSDETRLVLLILLVEVRSGASVLAALQRASTALPTHEDLRRVARMATVFGLVAALDSAGDLRSVVAQMARAQRSGAPLAATLRRLLEHDLAEDRARRLARARSLPVRLMVPVALLMLPGLVLLLYAPGLLSVLGDLTGGLP